MDFEYCTILYFLMLFCLGGSLFIMISCLVFLKAIYSITKGLTVFLGDFMMPCDI